MKYRVVYNKTHNRTIRRGKTVSKNVNVEAVYGRDVEGLNLTSYFFLGNFLIHLGIVEKEFILGLNPNSRPPSFLYGLHDPTNIDASVVALRE